MSAERGFTLLEALVAFTLLAAVLGAGLSAIGAGARGAAAAADTLTALRLAQNALAAARAGADAPPDAAPGDDPRFRTELAIAPDAETGLRRVAATVTWAGPGAGRGGGRAVRLATLIPAAAP